jgi:tRNA threonylcarbamoyladenosine modification (KEOPS) complex  Pcc1 subunit
VISIQLKLCLDPNMSKVIYGAMTVDEIGPSPVLVSDDPLTLRIEAPHIGRARAILNSYISCIYSILAVVSELEEMEIGRESPSGSSSPIRKT